MSREEAVNNLYATIKTKFEEDGVLQQVRCLLQSKMVALMKGTDDGSPLVPRPKSGMGIGDGGQRDARLQLVNQLILEYFHWHGFRYSAEMFAMESSCENSQPLRECLESVLGPFDRKNLPIILQLIAELMEQNKSEATVGDA